MEEEQIPADAVAVEEVAVVADKPVKAPKPDPIIQNGITLPKIGGLCHAVFVLGDQMMAELGTPPALSQVLERGKALGLNEGNIRVEYSRWKKFTGITDRIADPAKAEAVAAKVALKAEKDVTKAAEAAAKAEAKLAAKAEKDVAKAAKAEAAALAKAEKAQRVADAAAAAAAEAPADAAPEAPTE